MVGPRLPAAASPDRDALSPLAAVATNEWHELARGAIEPNGYYLPGWELAVNACAPGRPKWLQNACPMQLSPSFGRAAG